MISAQFKQFLSAQSNPPSKVTVKNYASDVNRFIRWVEEKFNKDFNPNDVSSVLIDTFKQESLVKYSASSVDRSLSSIRKFFHFLKLEGLISHSPFEQKLSLSAQALEKADPWRIRDFKNHLYVFSASHLTIKNYIIDVKQFLNWAQRVLSHENSWEVSESRIFSSLNAELIEEYKKRLLNEMGLSPVSVNRKLSSIRRYLSWAKEEGLLHDQPKISNLSLGYGLPIDSPEFSGNQTQLETEQAPSYSSLPPLRLVQKAKNGFVGFFDNLLIYPLSSLLDKTDRTIWVIRGKPVFKKGLSDKLAIPNFNILSPKQISNIPKSFYSPALISTKNFSLYSKVWHNVKHSRPEWYKKYHSYSFVSYLHFSILMFFISIMGYMIFDSFKPQNQPQTLAALPSAPARILSFQGRLTDASDNPITSKTALRMAIYNNLTATGSALLWQEVVSPTPDSDGIFSIILGKGTAIPQSLFAQNSALWLGVTVGTTSELSPRQQIATVAFATNSETLQGLPPITNTSSTANVILALNSSGNLTIGGTASPTFQATGGTFSLSGKAISITTTASSNGNIVLTPDGTGKIDLQKVLQNTSNNNSLLPGSVQVDDQFSVNTTSPGPALNISQSSSGDLIIASVSGNTKFRVSNNGTITNSSWNGSRISSTYGGTGIDTASSTGVPFVSSGTWSIDTNYLFANHGGTGQTSFSVGDILYASSSSQLARLGIGITSQCLIGGTTPSWSSCSAASSNWWDQTNGALYPNNSTVDLLVGGQATTSAKFGVLNMAGGTPTASISAASGANATTLTGLGVLGTTNMQTLTLGNSTTGDIVIDGGSGVVTLSDSTASRFILTDANKNLTFSGLSQVLVDTLTDETGSGVAVFGTSPAITTSLTTPSTTFSLVNTTATTVNFAGAATTLSMGASTGTTTINNNASVSGTLTLAGAARSIQTSVNNTLTIGGDTTGNISIAPNNGGAGSLLTINSLLMTLSGTTTLTGTSLTSITGGATAIDFTEFDVSATTGSITINDGGNAGQIDIESTVLDIDSLTFVGAGSLLSSGANTLTLDSGNNTLTIASTDTTLTASGITTITLGTSATINAGATALNLQADGTPDVNIAGGSGTTGCTIANATGNLTCSGTITGTGATGYWTRLAGNLSPATLNDTISATTSAAVALTLTQTGAFNALLVQDEASDTTPFVIDQSGNVGIGTTGPEVKLDVAGGSILLDNNEFYSAETAAGANTIILGITSLDDSTRLLSASGKDIGIYPGDASPVGITVKATSGNVGIGTTSPTSELHVTRPLSFGVTGKALAIFDQIEDQDIFAASKSGTTQFRIASDGDLLPGTDITQSIGASSSGRFKDLFLGPSSLHVQCTTGDGCGAGGLDYALGVNTSTGTFSIGVNGTSAIGNPLLSITQGGTVTIADSFAAGGRNLVIGDDTFFTDVDAANTLGLYSTSDTTIGSLKLGSAGPTLAGTSSLLTVNTPLAITGALTGVTTITTSGAINSQTISSAANFTGTITTPGYVSITGVGDASGNLRFSAANPYISASSYFIAPGGAYFNSLTVYTEATIQARGGVADDGGNLTLADTVDVTGGNLTVANADIYTYRTGGTTGVIFLNSAGTRYLYFDGTNYTMPSSNLYANGALLISDGNTNWDNSYGYITDGNTNWDNSYGYITSTNCCLEMRWDGSTPFIDFSNDASIDYDARIILTGDETIEFQSANVRIVGYNLIIDGTCTSQSADCAVDFAEFYPASEPIEKGELVVANPSSKETVKRSSIPYENGIIGITSTNPGFLLSDHGAVTGRDQLYNPVKPNVALAGRVPLKVSTESGQIKIGDPLTSSSIPGVAMKATKAGQIVGKAMENYDSEGVDKIIAFVNVSWYDPDVQLTDAGVLSLGPNVDGNFEVQRDGRTIDRIGVFSDLVVARIKTGYFETGKLIVTGSVLVKNLTSETLASNKANFSQLSSDSLAVLSDQLTIGGQNIRDYIANILTEVLNNRTIEQSNNQLARTDIISPLSEEPDGKIAIKLNDNEGKSKLEIRNASDSAVVSIDSEGNASFSGKLTAQDGQFNNATIEQLNNTGDASISGTLRASRIVADQLELSEEALLNLLGLEPQSSSSSTLLASSYEQPASASANTFNSSGQQLSNIAIEQLTVTQSLMAYGPSSFFEISVADRLFVGAQLSLADRSINVLGGNLELQPLKQGGVAFVGGEVEIDTQGNLKVNGNAYFARDLEVKGNLLANIISPLPDQDLVFNLAPSGERLASSSDSPELRINNSSHSAILTINSFGDLLASGAGTFNKLNLSIVKEAQAVSPTEVIATGSAGVAQIQPNKNELTIKNPLVTENSLIYITPKTATPNQSLFLLRQVPGQSFTVGISQSINKKIPFNWILIN